jgi:hypothetical protein
MQDNKRINMKPRRKARSLIRRIVLYFRKKYFGFKYRNVDPDLCCCGDSLSREKGFDSICAHGGFRSMKEYLITIAVYPSDKEKP